MTAVATPVVATRSDDGVLGGVSAVCRGELVKLAAHTRIRVVLVLCAATPFVAVVLLRASTSSPADTLFGRWVHASGFAVPLVILSFAGQWVLPTLAGLVAGDIFSSEDHHGTWKAVLTRSRSRSAIFAGKALAAVTWTVVAVLVVGLASTVAGVAGGTQPLVDLSGRAQPSGHCLALVAVSWATTLPPALGFTAVALALSVVTRRSVAGIGGPLLLGLVMQLLSLVNGPDLLRVLLLSTPLGTWHGLWVDPSFAGPLVQGFVVSAAWFVVAGAVAYLAFLRRDIAPS